MPTGYTAELYEGDGQSFEKFVWSCARGMGALIMMRDDPSNAPIPERFEPRTDYYDTALAAAEARLVELRGMTAEEILQANLNERAEVLASRAKQAVKRSDLRRRYEAMLAEVAAWEPPTEDHQGLKKLMVDQLTESIRFDCGKPGEEIRYPPMPEADPANWFEEQIAKAERNIEHHTVERAKEIERTESRNGWLAELRGSLHAHA